MSRSTYEVTNLQQTRSPRSKFATTTNQASKRYTRCLIIWRAPPASGCALASAAHVKKSMHTHTICQRGELSNVTIQCLKNWNMARSEELWNHARSGAPLHNLPDPATRPCLEQVWNLRAYFYFSYHAYRYRTERKTEPQDQDDHTQPWEQKHF